MVTKRRTSTELEKSNYQFEKANDKPAFIDIPTETREFEYSTPTSVSRTVYSEPVSHTKPSSSSESDVMPSIQTMRYLKEKNASQANNRERLESKTKLMLAIYMIVVVVLSAIVIGTGIAIGNVSERVSALESEFSAQTEVLNAQYNQIDKLQDPDYIRGKAYNNGMENVENVTEVPLLELGDPISYEARTNWFDSFCKWVGSIIGG